MIRVMITFLAPVLVLVAIYQGVFAKAGRHPEDPGPAQ